MVLSTACSQMQAWLREVNGPAMQSRLHSGSQHHYLCISNNNSCLSSGPTACTERSQCRESPIVPSALKETCCIMIKRRRRTLLNAALPLVSCTVEPDFVQQQRSQYRCSLLITESRTRCFFFCSSIQVLVSNDSSLQFQLQQPWVTHLLYLFIGAHPLAP